MNTTGKTMTRPYTDAQINRIRRTWAAIGFVLGASSVAVTVLGHVWRCW